MAFKAYFRRRRKKRELLLPDKGRRKKEGTSTMTERKNGDPHQSKRRISFYLSLGGEGERERDFYGQVFETTIISRDGEKSQIIS